MTTRPDLAPIFLTGSRTWTDAHTLEDTLLDVWHDALEDGYDGVLLIHGACETGADHIGDTWAIRNGVPRDPHPADWNGPCAPECRPGHRRFARGRDYCPTAGPRRKQQMVDLRPLLVVAAHRANSPGTADCVGRAERAGVPVLTLTTAGLPR